MTPTSSSDASRPRPGLGPFRPGRAVAGLAVAAAVWLAGSTYAGALVAGKGGAEAAFLARLAAIVVAATALAAALLPARSAAARLPAAGGLLAVALLWIAPAGATRGTAITMLLVALFSVVASRIVGGADREPPGNDGDLRDVLGRLRIFLPLAVGAQALLRSEDVLRLTVEVRAPVRLFVLPMVAAAALALLSRRFGVGRTALAAGLTLLLRPGLDVPVTLALAALAAGAFVRLEETTLEATGAGGPRRMWSVRAAAVAAFALPVLWEPRSGLIAAASGAVLALPASALSVAVGMAAVVAAAASPLRGAGAAATALLALPLLAPAPAAGALGTLRRFLPIGRRFAAPGRPVAPSVIGGLLVAVAASLAGPEALAGPTAVGGLAPGTLAAPVALLVLLAASPGRFESLSRAWATLLFAGCALLAGYPWLRSRALEEALGLAGIAWSGWGVVVLLAVTAAVAWLIGPRYPELDLWTPSAPGATRPPALDPAPSERRFPRLPGAAPLVLGLALVAVVARQPTPPEPLIAEPVVLDAAGPELSFSLVGGLAARYLSIESHLANAAGLAAGTPVATIRLIDAAGGAVEIPLRAGLETAEWAARRPDVAAALPLAPPPAWRSYLDPDGSFFGQRYRARWRLAPRGPAIRRIEAVRSAELPPEVEVVLFRLEVG